MSSSEQDERRRMRSDLDAVQNILGYRFRNEKLLEDALTHFSHPKTDQFERLEFLGDAALGLAVSDHLFRSLPSGDPHVLNEKRKELVGNPKLARVNVDNNLFRYVRYNPEMDRKIRDYMNDRNSGAEPNKFLADMVEAIAGALYVDSGYNSKTLWKHFGRLICGEEVAGNPWQNLAECLQVIATAMGAFSSPSSGRD